MTDTRQLLDYSADDQTRKHVSRTLGRFKQKPRVKSFLAEVLLDCSSMAALKTQLILKILKLRLPNIHLTETVLMLEENYRLV